MTKRVAVTLFFAAILLVLCAIDADCQLSATGAGDLLSDQSITAAKELRLNSGIRSLSFYAHAYYKIGVEKRRTGNYLRAVQAFKIASELDPYFLDPHFSLFRSYLLRDPGKAFNEISAVVQIVREDFLAQYLLYKNVAVLGYLSLLMSLLFFIVIVCVRHVSRLKHVVAERLAAEMSLKAAGWVSAFVLLQPLVWGPGAAGVILCYSGALWKSMNKREKIFGLLLLSLILSTPLLSRVAVSHFPPIGNLSPTFVSYTTMKEGWNDELEKALLTYTTRLPDVPLYHFAYGTAARRAGKLGIARTELETAVRLSGPDAASLNNLGNVYFNLGNLAAAEHLYTKAIDANSSLPQPHYNLSQVYTKRLMFSQADQEFKTADLQNPGLISEFSLNSREQLNRSVIDVDPRAQDFWNLLLREKPAPGYSVIPAGALRFVEIGTAAQSAAIALLFALSVLGGVLAFRNLYTFSCSNCGKIICGRCLARVHRKLFCLKCGAAAGALKSEEFTRLLLNNQLKLEARKTRPASVIFGTLVPGFRLIQKGDSVRGFAFLLFSSLAALYAYSAGGYITDFMPHLRYQQEHLLKYLFAILPLAAIHGFVLFLLSREAGPQPVSLRLVKTQPASAKVKDGTTGKP